MRHRGGGGRGTIDSRHRNGGKVYSKRRRITPINYEAARRRAGGGGGGRKRERGRRKCKFRRRGEERRRCRGFHSRLRRRNTRETISPRREEKFCYCKQSKAKRIRGFDRGEGKFTGDFTY